MLWSSDLWMGVTFAVFRSFRTMPVSSESEKIKVKGLIMEYFTSFTRAGLMSSWPATDGLSWSLILSISFELGGSKLLKEEKARKVLLSGFLCCN